MVTLSTTIPGRCFSPALSPISERVRQPFRLESRCKRNSQGSSVGLERHSSTPRSYLELVPSSHLLHGRKDHWSNGCTMRRGGSRSTTKVCAIQQIQAQDSVSPDLTGELIEYLSEDLPRLFEKGEMDRSRFEEKMYFEDPITKYDSMGGYLFNIQLLRLLFDPILEVQSIKQSGPSEITTRWTMSMNFKILPWNPRIIFTGLSIYGINPDSGKFNSHIDLWDSIDDNKYFSREGLIDLITQSLQFHGTPKRFSPAYKVLLRRASYEVREYSPFAVVEGKSNSSNIDDTAKGYISGRNSASKTMEFGSPIINHGISNSEKTSEQLILSLDEQISEFPSPISSEVHLKQFQGGFAACRKFSGEISKEVILSEENVLRASLIQDGLKPQNDFYFLDYNNEFALDFMKRNEVLIWLGDFSLDQI